MKITDALQLNTSGMEIAKNHHKRFVFISDLHFDRIAPKPISREVLNERAHKMLNGEISPGFPEYEEDADFLERENIFILFVKKHFPNDILLLPGDFHTDFQRSLAFVEKLEKERIESYFVLGNHDFSSSNQTGFDDIIDLFDSATRSHNYSKFLMTGKKYYHENVCIIGDTGWHADSKFIIAQRESSSTDHFKKNLYVHESKKWLKFATATLKEEKQVLLLTHFPQAVFPNSPDSLKWVEWTDAKVLLDVKHCWKVFGHTHQAGLFQYYNNVCLQQGYTRRNSNRSGYPNYAVSDFGILEKRQESNELLPILGESFELTCAIQYLLPYYSPVLIRDEENEIEVVTQIVTRGFKRPGHADNKRSLAALITDKQAYLDRVKENLSSIELQEYMGYVLKNGISLSDYNAILAAIRVLENVTPSNARIFMTAFVITSYVYNNNIGLVNGMRPLDDYDILRWFLEFATLKKFAINPEDIKTVRKNDKEHFLFHNVLIHLPKVNNKSLTVAEALELLSETPLLSENKFSYHTLPENTLGSV